MQADHTVAKRKAKARPAMPLDAPEGFRTALRNIWPPANRDEAQGKSPALSIIMYPSLFPQAALSALLYF